MVGPSSFETMLFNCNTKVVVSIRTPTTLPDFVERDPLSKSLVEMRTQDEGMCGTLGDY